MRYWVYDERSKKVLGPHLLITLVKVPGFGPETKVAPEGARRASEWKRAKEIAELAELFAPPPAPDDKKKGPAPGGPAA